MSPNLGRKNVYLSFVHSFSQKIFIENGTLRLALFQINGKQKCAIPFWWTVSFSTHGSLRAGEGEGDRVGKPKEFSWDRSKKGGYHVTGVKKIIPKVLIISTLTVMRPDVFTVN